MTDQELLEAVNKIMEEEILPALAAHGGGARVTRVENGDIYVELQGGCRGCPGARMTLRNGIEGLLRERLGDAFGSVIDDTDHGGGFC